MKQRSDGCGVGSCITSCLQVKYEMIDYEMQVAGILLELRNLMLISHRLPLSLPSWGIKRRRSVEDNSSLRRVCSPSPEAVPSPQEVAGIVSPAFQIEKAAAKVEEATSPATPLSFSPSESDEKPKPKPLKRKFKTKEELLQMKNDGTQSIEILRKIEQIRDYILLLQAENQILRARKRELTLGNNERKSQVDNPASTSNVHHNHHNHHQQQEHVAFDQRPLMIDRTARNVETRERSYYDQYQYGQALSVMGSRNGMAMSMIVNERVGKGNVPDLNQSPPLPQAESAIFCQRGLIKTMAAAEARKKRIKIKRDKNLNKILLLNK